MPVVDEFVGADFRRLVQAPAEASFLRDVEDRAVARLVPFTPITPDERFSAFHELGFRPHGLYLPDDADQRFKLLRARDTIGRIEQVDVRQERYYALQDLCERMYTQGVPGHWNGQQAVARSRARFRLVAWSRRGGKTFYAACEALGTAKGRPRSWIWLAAPTMNSVSRSFDMVIRMIEDLKIPTRVIRNSAQEKLIVLDNLSRIEGVSLDQTNKEGDKDDSNAGAAIDLAVVDEAAQISEQAWKRVILPPLSDRNGLALLISSFSGEDNFFFEKAETAKKEQAKSGGESTWEVFTDASYVVNFFVFPQGRRTPVLLELEKEMDAREFAEQFGGVPARARNRVFPEFKENVHVGSYPFNPDMPVYLACDPSGGANPYAVVAIQDYGDYVVIIDEYYETHTLVENIAPVLDAQPWRANVTEMVVDSAWPADIERWIALKYPAFPVAEKPQIDERLPYYRHLLRDPMRFYAFRRTKINRLLTEMGLDENADLDFTDDQQRALDIQLEEALSDVQMTIEDVKTLRGCSRLFIDRRCVNTIEEHRLYRFVKRRTQNGGWREVPLDKWNHVMDALGYFVWQTRRYTQPMGAVPEQNSLATVRFDSAGRIPLLRGPHDEELDGPTPEQERARAGMLAMMRERYAPGNPLQPQNMLRAC